MGACEASRSAGDGRGLSLRPALRHNAGRQMQPNDQRRLRSSSASSPYHVVLVEPEIPPNTGNIARLCAATGTPLHLVGKLGFRIDEHAVRRAGLDYWHLVEVNTHTSLLAFEEQASPGRSWLLSGKAQRSYLDTRFAPGDRLIFGKESCGLDEQLLLGRQETVIGIPTLGEVRSLNLANAVAIVLYEALRQGGYLHPASFR